MQKIYTHENVVVLHSVKNILARNDIESFVKNEHTIPNGARHGIANMFLELWIINDQDFAKASLVMEEQLNNPEPSDPWNCPKCDEENDGSFDFCWKCQTENSAHKN
ncbi:MAG: hypothetical protein ACI8XU_000378 [Kiritimatiellia bacterium]|jgi:hypothetical protein